MSAVVNTQLVRTLFLFAIIKISSIVAPDRDVMRVSVLILRWIGAVIVALHVYLLALVFGTFIETKLLGIVTDLPIACATTVAAIAGALVVPRKQWRNAVLALWVLALLYPLWVFLRGTSLGQLSAGGLSALLYTLSGGYLAYFLVKGGFAKSSRNHSGNHVTT